MTDILNSILLDDRISNLIKSRQLSRIESEVGIEYSNLSREELNKLLRLLQLLLSHSFSTSVDTETDVLKKTYDLLKSIDINQDEFVPAFDDIFGVDGLAFSNHYYFLLASIALKAEDTIKLRLDLQSYNGYDLSYDDSWKTRLLNKIFYAHILLLRKQNGFKDIRESLQTIIQLQKEQAEFEKKYLDKFDESKLIREAEELLGYYHWSKLLTETAEYLIQGYDYSKNLDSLLRVHSDIANRIFSNKPRIQSILKIFTSNLNYIRKNSIWHSTNDIQIEKLKEFCKLRSQTSKSIIELLPSQRNALENNLLDLASNVTVIEMPTSSGKTLLAEFNMIVVKAINPTAKIVYIVPSRALVNQVYNDLKDDFDGLGMKIEKTSSAIEVDPSENDLLNDEIDILVSTPEKIDLLIRRNHESVKNVSLFVIDEAHTIQNGSRGAKLELLLSILKRERQKSKFMFLSPFLKGSASVIASWMAGEKFKNTIKVNWKPSEKLLIGIKQKKNFKEFTHDLIPSAYVDIKEGLNIGSKVVNVELSGTTKQKYLGYVAKTFGKENKSILYLCLGPGMVDKQATFLSKQLPNRENSENIDLVRKFIDDEVGRPTILTNVLSKGIAVHHAGLSDETKLLVEHLIRSKEIQHVFATSTLAEGVNFPVSTVYFDTYMKGPVPLSTSDFWNIAGRAGRTLVDNYGKLIFPFNTKENQNTAFEIVSKSSEEIASVLLEFINSSELILSQFEGDSSGVIGNLSYEFPNSLAPLIQYLIHLLNTTNNESYLEIEDLFKDSLGYFQLKDEEQKRKFLQVCSKIYIHLQEKYQKGTLVLADKTGFSVPSVLNIMRAENRQNPAISSPESWEPTNLFDPSTNNLSEKIKVIAKLKETRLGTDSSRNPFNEEAVAKMLIGWVKGERLYNISGYHPTFSSIGNEAKRINDFVKYINGARFKASWGLGALEGIIKSSGEDISENSYVPSLVYYGVDSKESLMLRMAGIPRRLANSMSPIVGDGKKNLSQLRDTIKTLNSNEWDSLVPKNSSLSGAEWKRLAEILVK